MKTTKAVLGLLVLLLALCSGGSVWAETIEMVTYYPTASTGEICADSLKVGNAYCPEDVDDGEAIFVGPVGIGTTAPQSDLEIYRQDEAYLRVSGTGINATPENFSGIELGGDLPAGGGIDRIWQLAHKRGGAGAVNDLHVNYFNGAAWSTKMAFKPDGNVGIGTASPQVKLDVAQNSAIRVGNTYLSSGGVNLAHFASNAWYDGSGSWQIPNPASASGLIQYQDSDLYFYQRSAGAGVNAWDTRMVLRANGFVGIGENTPDARLTLKGVSGDAGGFLRLKDQFGNARSLYMTANNYTLGFWCPANVATLSNTGVWTDASDRAYKKGIGPLRYGLNEVLQLKPRQYRMKADNTPQVGFIAQEVRGIIPEVVYGEEPNLNLSYDQMLPVVVRAVQQLKTENDDLRSRNERLEARVKALEGK